MEVDISKLEPGQLLTVEWRGKPVWILKRTPEMLKGLSAIEGKLADPKSAVKDQQPDYAANPTRSIKQDILVVVGICTHLGCSPDKRLEAGAVTVWAPTGPVVSSARATDRCLTSPVACTRACRRRLICRCRRIPHLSDTRLLLGEDKKGAA